ncbi:MAG: 50S ribosomal protein L13 [Candidatus Delongbacteria bacterium]|nr:50S ribosomal protein L13 [Candidatus Delongbacteria bacterium]
MKSYMPVKKDVGNKWVLIDADGMVLGRLATQIAMILRGKTKPYYINHLDCGDSVIIINADKIKTTGGKEKKKVYFHHSGLPGGAKFVELSHLKKQKPTEIIRHAVKGMIPNTVMGRHQIKKLHVYTGTEHPHQAQQPETIILK